MGDYRPCAPDRLEIVCFFDAGRRFGIESWRVLAKRPLDPPDAGSAGLVVRLFPDGTRVLRAEEPIMITTLPAASIHPVPPFISSQCSLAGLRALAFDAQGILFIMEPS